MHSLPQALAEQQAQVLRTLVSEDARPQSAIPQDARGRAGVEESRRHKALVHIMSGVAEGTGIGGSGI